MPCDAIAMARGRVGLNLAQELDRLGMCAVSQALAAALRKSLAHLGEPTVTSPQGGRRIEIRVGSVVIRICADWDVSVLGVGGRSNRRVVEEVKEAVVGLLNGLGGLALQSRIAQTIAQSGYRVVEEARAPSGALVLQVDL